jgi:dienelactone hydrolase
MGGRAKSTSDIVAARDYAVTVLKFPSDRVFLFGESYGASLVLDAANHIGATGGLVLVAWNGLGGDGGQLEHARVLAFHGGMDPFASAKSVGSSFRKRFGQQVTRPAGNRWHVFPDEGHHFFRAASWAQVCAEALNLMELN